ncbi:MAG: hypothetical protein COY80_02805 [Candidatus Pacebacteria bacterium CG_4_10_14_0_8_um_filter_42_14]|nr:MAG: hypothetical protein COY80_02805 [Candidatus Pacebacteria bacterium CG_4_10_14_0_8_um_filter_42_14]
MTVSIIYATYSNSTSMASEVLKQALEAAGHVVAMNMAFEATPELIKPADLIVLASPSWDFNDEEGQPHEDFFNFFEKMPKEVFKGKKCALLGLGDKNYNKFCGAVDVFRTQLEERDAKIIGELRLDQYYLNEAQCVESIKSWAGEITK